MNTVKQQKYYDAIQRILNGKPSNPELKDLANKGKLKLNNYSVEREAGMSTGSLRRHPDIKAAIKKATITKSKDDLIKNTEAAEPELIQHYEQELTKERSKRIKSNKLKRQYQGEVERVTVAMKEQLSHHQNMMFAIFDLIPEDKRQGMFNDALHVGGEHKNKNGRPPIEIIK
ncbi:hypothetical protein [Vibrio splendidus]|uniref:hypothetical protein n=1 Tax=Vibrio splendidus TaxID=29497 RepID=UPI000CF4F2EA|nr:hypothetical protein [Vibrio splendidus]PQJ47271.1 hypothetical protein BTO12_25165 [Vibrio splendidus]